MSRSLLPTSRITSVRFSIAGTADIECDSVVEVTSVKNAGDDIPNEEGLYSPSMGTIGKYDCGTCSNSHAVCPGHPGVIHLNYPVWNVASINEILWWFKIICVHCSRIHIAPAILEKIPLSQRWEHFKHKTIKESSKCHHCGEIQVIVKRDKKDPMMLVAEQTIDSTLHRNPLYPHAVERILERISADTVELVGRPSEYDPTNLILNALQVTPVVNRPDVRKPGSNKNKDDPISGYLKAVLRKNANLKNVDRDAIAAKPDVTAAVSPQVLIISSSGRDIVDLNNAVNDMICARGATKTDAASLFSRQIGKQGRIRKNQLGKRTFNMCRGVIACCISLRIDEVGVPLDFAQKIQIEERVCRWNYASLSRAVINGREQYPGASEIIKRDTGERISTESADRIILEEGDVVMRDVVNGDMVGFNRQPSLLLSNIAGFRVLVIPNPAIKAINMNPIACSLCGADFDGDAMHLIFAAKLAARCEIDDIVSVSNWVISPTSSNPAIGQINDSIIGMALLTRGQTRFTKHKAMRLFAACTWLPDLRKYPDVMTGRDVISAILSRTPINFSRSSQWYDAKYVPYFDYDPTDIKVVIEHGIHKSGVLDKKSICGGAHGNIYHVIANEYGPQISLEVMWNMQQIAVAYLNVAGFTIGASDIIISESTRQAIANINVDFAARSQLITEQLYRGELIPPIDMTVEQYYEQQQINALRPADSFHDPIFSNLDTRDNNLLHLIMSGSKGSHSHLENMLCTVGQKLINSRRVEQKFGYKRTLPYFKRFDSSAASRGYVSSSFVGGLKLSEFIFAAMGARTDMISRAIGTQLAGTQGRIAMKNHESNVVNAIGQVVKSNRVTSMLYGEDGLDPRTVERVVFPGIMDSDAALIEQFSHPDFPAEFATIKADREKYRKIFLQIEQFNVNELIKAERLMPVHVARIAQNVMTSLNISRRAVSGDKEPTAQPLKLPELRLAVAAVTKFCDTLHYVMSSDAQLAVNGAISLHKQKATWLVSMLVRLILHPKFLQSNGLTKEITDMVLEKIKTTYKLALVAPGTSCSMVAALCYSEPLTQYMLDAQHRAATGGSSKDGMNRSKDVLGAREITDMHLANMFMRVRSDLEHDKEKVTAIAQSLEEVTFKQFVSASRVFAEQFGKPVHSRWRHETEMIGKFITQNPNMPPPKNLAPWCLHFTLNSDIVIRKQVSMEQIIGRLRNKFSNIYWVYSAENSAEMIVRAYASPIGKQEVDLKYMLKLKDNAYAVMIRGVSNILKAEIIKLNRSEIRSDGSISGVVDKYAIRTSGTNIKRCMEQRDIDRLSITSNAIQETYRMFGIEAARQKIISEMRNLVSICNPRHYIVYADEMTSTGVVTQIGLTGPVKREKNNTFLRMGFRSPIPVVTEAAESMRTVPISGISAPLMIGSTPQIGTIYSRIYVDVPFVMANSKSAANRIDELLA